MLKLNSSEDSEGCHLLIIILEDWQTKITIGHVSRLQRSYHPFLQLNTRDAEISAFIHTTIEEVTVTLGIGRGRKNQDTAEKVQNKAKQPNKKLKRCKKAKRPKYSASSRLEVNEYT